jgi:hypothetical protein
MGSDLPDVAFGAPGLAAAARPPIEEGAGDGPALDQFADRDFVHALATFAQRVAA